MLTLTTAENGELRGQGDQFGRSLHQLVGAFLVGESAHHPK
jgi:hypothetical protein